MLYTEAGESLAQVAQKGGGCPIPGKAQGQVGQGSEWPHPVEDVPAHCRGLDWMASKGPFQPKPFCGNPSPLLFFFFLLITDFKKMEGLFCLVQLNCSS